MRYFFQLWRQIQLQWKMWYFFSVMETYYSTTLKNICSETWIQQKCLPNAVNNVVLFSVMEKNYSTPLITVCSETSIQQKKKTSVSDVVLISVMETDPTSVKHLVPFFSRGEKLLNHFNYCMQWNLNPTKTASHYSEQCGTFFQLWKQIQLQWTMWYFFSVMETYYSNTLIILCSETSIQQKRLHA